MFLEVGEESTKIWFFIVGIEITPTPTAK